MSQKSCPVTYRFTLKLTILSLGFVLVLAACANKPTPSVTIQVRETAPATEAATLTPPPTHLPDTPTATQPASPTPFPTPSNLLGEGWLPSGSVLRIGSFPGIVQRDPTTGEVLWYVQTGGTTFSRSASPDGNWIAASVRKNSMYVWNAATGALQVSTEGIDDWLQTYSWSPDSRYLAASFWSNELPSYLVVMDVPAGKIAYRIENQPGTAQHLLWTTDNSLLITAAYNSSDVIIRDAASGEIIHRLVHETQNGGVAFLYMTSDETKLVAVYGDPEYLGPREVTVIWDIKTGMQLWEYKSSVLRDVALSPDGTRLALSDSSAYNDFTLSKAVPIWETETGELILELTLPYHVEDQYDIESGTWSPDGSMFAAALGPYLAVWDTANGGLIRAFETPICYCAIRWSEDQTSLSFRDSLWVIATGQSIAVSPTPTPVASASSALWPVTDVIWSKDGTSLITGSGFIGFDGVNVWDAQTGEHLREFDGTNPETGWRYYGVASLSLAPDGEQLAVAALGFDQPQSVHMAGSLTLWDVGTGEFIRTISDFDDGIDGAAWSPDGRWMAAAYWEGLVMWDTATWEEVYRDDIPTCCVAWSPDGDHLAIGRDTNALILDPTGQVLKTENFIVDERSDHGITALAWSPDGADLAVGIEGGTVILWNMASAERPVVLEQQVWIISSMAWSPDGKLLAVSSGNGGPPAPYCVSGACFEPGLFSDHSLVIWDTTTGKPFRVLYGHAAEIEAVAWSPDGTQLVSASLDGAVLVWTIK